MKRLKYILSITILLIVSMENKASAQGEEAAQLLLNWEKLNQLKNTLETMYQGYVILDRGYNTIKNIAQGNYTLHEAFFNGLAMVNPSVRNYKRIPYIIDYQKLLVKEYQRAWNRFSNDKSFTFAEVEYLGSVYSFLFQASLRNLDDLATILTATKLSMTDYERMQAIDRIFFDMQSKVMFLNSFNNSTSIVAMQRARSRSQVTTMRKLYGVN